jgi:hypothetical protein
VPIENPLIRSRPSIVPIAIARSRKISGEVEMTHRMVSIGARSLGLKAENSERAIQIR